MKTPWLVGLALAAAAAAARAQQPQVDPRWEPWLGCWTAAEGAAPSPTGKTPTVCVIPAAGGVDVLTVVDTSIVARDHIEADPARHAVSREGCAGWETDTWAQVGDRLYRRSAYACPGGVKRSTSEVFAISPEWEWLDVQGLASHGDMGVRTLRYRTADVPAVPAIEAALAGQGEVGIARGAAAAPPAMADVVEASRAVEAPVVEAWLAEEGEAFELNGRQLLALADSGVPGRVIDVMVAMSYPKAFTVAAPSARGGFNGAEPTRRPAEPDTTAAYQYPYGDLYAGYPPGWDYWSPWSWSLYGYYSPFFYSPYGQFAPWGYGPYGGWYYGGGTIVVTTGTGTGTPPPDHGTVVKGHGYVYHGGSGSGARPAESAGSEGSRGSSSSGASPAPPPRSSSGSGGQAGQHAKPKP